MLEFFRMIFKAIRPGRCDSPKPDIAPNPDIAPEPLIPAHLAELFAQEDVWLVEFEPDTAKIPNGCNFILWFESDRSLEELLKTFESNGWQAQVGYSGFVLTQIVPITSFRSGRTEDHRINMAAMVSAKPSHLRVLAGNCTHPDFIGTEFRKLISRIGGQSNNLFCLYIEAGTLWREVPATAELLGMDADALSDADREVLNTGYIVQIDDASASCSSVKQLQREVKLLAPSVVVDEKGYTHIECWPYPVRRLWNQVREVGLYDSWGGNFLCVTRYLWIAGDSVEDFIYIKSKGIPEFIERLNVLPGFLLKDFEAALKRPPYNEGVVLWRRSDGAVNEDFPA